MGSRLAGAHVSVEDSMPAEGSLCGHRAFEWTGGARKATPHRAEVGRGSYGWYPRTPRPN